MTIELLGLKETIHRVPGTPFIRYCKQQKNKQKAKHVKNTYPYNRYLAQETSETQTKETTKE